ncbi:MAG: glycosyltransferase family 2 protein [Nitrospirae bacterium]|nr:glycosyltransferase family 2 protein [Nitrospirota bacterium]
MVKDKPYLSVVIPVYNEADNIPGLNSSIMDVLFKTGQIFEIIYVDDCSTDETFSILRKICAQYGYVRAVRLRRNFGQSAAMSAGFDFARGEIVVAMDGDMQNDPADIPALLTKLNEGYDVVNGWRKDRKDRLFSRRIPSVIANWIIGRTTGVRLHDYGCSLKAYRAEVIKNVPLYGGLHRFIPALASIYGARITEMAVNHHPRLHGKSKYTISRAFRVLIDLIAVIFLKFFLERPLHIFGWSGIVLLLSGTLIDGYLAFQKIFHAASLSNRPLLLFGTLLILAGLQLFSMGILAEIQVRTYYESQGKPIYSVRDRINLE